MTWICFSGNGSYLLAKWFIKTKSMPRHCAPFHVICPMSLERNALIAIGAVSKNLLDLLSLAKWSDKKVQSFTLRSKCWWSNGCTECGLRLLLPKMCIHSWLKSWHDRNEAWKTKKQVVASWIWGGQKTHPETKTLEKPRQNQLAVVGKAGGRLSAAYHVVCPSPHVAGHADGWFLKLEAQTDPNGNIMRRWTMSNHSLT